MRKHSNIKLLMTAKRISVTTGINKFVHFLQNLPGIGKHVSDSLYSNKDGKLGVFAVVCVLKSIQKIVLKAIYVGIMLIAIPSIMPSFVEDNMRFIFNVDAVMFMLFFAAFLGASLAFAKCINFDMGQDLVMLDKFRADSNIYMPLRIFEHKIIDFILYFPYIFVLALTEKYTILDGFIILLTLEFVKIIFEAVILFSFTLFRKINLTSYKILSYICVGLGLFCALLPIILIASGNIFDVKPLLINPVTFIITLALAAVSVVYIRRYKYYRELAWGQIVTYNLAIEKAKNNQKTQVFGDAQKWNEAAENEVYLPENIKKLRGYSFFNALFFFRHKKFFRKKILSRSILIVSVALIIWGVFFIAKTGVFKKDNSDNSIEKPTESQAEIQTDDSDDDDDDLDYTTSLQVFVFLAYALSIGRQATAAMFSNCDVTMLRYKFYRDKRITISNFNFRLRQIMKLNIPVFLSLLFGHLTIDFILYQRTGELFLTPQKMLVSIAAFAVLWLFFSFHDLFIYYIIQPYNEEYAAKNIWFNLVQALVYMLCYFNIFVESVNIYAYTAIITVITASYFVLGMLAIYRFSEKTFKLR